MKKVLFMMVLAAIAMISCKNEVKVTDITLNKQKLELSVGGTEFLKATTTPADAQVQFTWASSDTQVATVTANGKVTAKAGGKATITVTAGEVSATCEVIVIVGDYSTFNITDYDLFGGFEPIEGTDTVLLLQFQEFESKDNPEGDTLVKCIAAYTTVYAWGDGVDFESGTGFFGDGFVCSMEKTVFYLINQDLIVDDKNYKGFYLGAGGVTVVNTGDNKYYNGNCQAGQLDPATYGEFVQAQHDKDLKADFEKMQEKTYGAFVTRPSADQSGELDSWYGLYNGHIDYLLIYDATATKDLRFAAEITFGNLDESQYLYGFEYDQDEWKTNKKVVLKTPYAEHYSKVKMTYDEYGLFSENTEKVAHYSIGDMSRVHKELPTINKVAADKFRISVK